MDAGMQARVAAGKLDDKDVADAWAAWELGGFLLCLFGA